MCLFVSSQRWGEDPGWEARLLAIILLVIQDRKVLLVDDDSGIARWRTLYPLVFCQLWEEDSGWEPSVVR